MNNYVIWCTYHNKDIPSEYNLYETEHFKLFNTDDFNLKEDNINYLHDYVGDMSTFYYIWKNQIKSDYIGFCQYRRHFTTIDFDSLKKNGIYAYCNWPTENQTIYERHCGVNNIFNDFYILSFINYVYNVYHINIQDMIFKDINQNLAYHNMLVYRWDIFNEVCEFMFGFLNYLSCGTWKNEESLIHLSKMYHFKKGSEDEIYINYYWKRAYSVLNELLVGMFVNIKYNVNMLPFEKYFITLNESTINTIEDFDKWYKMNIKTGVTKFYVNEYVYKKLLETDIRKYIYVTNEYPGYLTEIKLKLNERIHCDTSLDFNNGNFTIENY